MASSPAAACVDLWKTYSTSAGQVQALAGIHAEFAPGTLTAVAGPSGSGKSTLLKILAGLERPTHGEIVIQGWHLVGAGRRRLRHLRRHAITYVFQRPADNFVPHLTLADHARLERDPASGRRDRHDPGEVFRRFGIGHRLGDRPHRLSGGEQARAAFALALLRGAPLIVADEPTAELDEQSALDLLAAIRLYSERGTTFVVATHDQSVTEVADELLRLDRGRLASEGDSGPESPASRSTSDKEGGGEAIAVARGVRKSYRRGQASVQALGGVSFELRPGELVALVGRSGSGKSTLLNLLAGWQQPDAGDITYRSRGGKARDPDRLGWGELAVLPQKFGLMEELSVRENVEYPARLGGLVADRREWIDHLVHDLGLDELVDRRPQEISVGQQQRTALARALALTPAVLLADEPTAHQDGRSRSSVLALLRRVADAGSCCVVATHEEGISEYADVTWRIAEGLLATEPDRRLA